MSDRRVQSGGVTSGVHHVTAISGGAQANADFYVGLLGLRLIKKTVNFDDPGTYHLYYGDEGGSPGAVMTFFPWADAPRGTQGAGQLTVTSFSVPADSLGYWKERLGEHGVRVGEPYRKFGEEVIPFVDESGMMLELVGGDDRRVAWGGGTVSAEYAPRGFRGVTLSVGNPDRTAQVLTEYLGFREAGSEDGRGRYEAGDGGPGNTVDIVDGSAAPAGRMGVGTVHHVAFRVPDRETHLAVRERVASLGFDVTPVLDRNYFESIYFREPGGVLFEVATDPPGFAADEDQESLGTELKLPAWLESRRDRIEQALDPLEVPGARA